jgi:hypothetical protein
MAQPQPTEPITVRAAKETIAEIDILAAAMDRLSNRIQS